MAASSFHSEHPRTLGEHMRALLDLPLAAGATDCAKEVESYKDLRKVFDETGLRDGTFTTNVEAYL
jgi:hypothetical protein